MCDHDPREDAMVVLERDSGGRPTVWCDPCLADLVQALNDAGLVTVASCCGHGHRPGQVSLADGRELALVGGFEADLADIWPDINGQETQ